MKFAIEAMVNLKIGEIYLSTDIEWNIDIMDFTCIYILSVKVINLESKCLSKSRNRWRCPTIH